MHHSTRFGFCVLLACATLISCKDKNDEKAARAAETPDKPLAEVEAEADGTKAALQALCTAHGNPAADDGIPAGARLKKASDWANGNINNVTVDRLLVAGGSWYDVSKAAEELSEETERAGIESCGLLDFFNEMNNATVSAAEAVSLLKSLDATAMAADDWSRTQMRAVACYEVAGCARSCALALDVISRSASEDEAKPLARRCRSLSGPGIEATVGESVVYRMLKAADSVRDELDEQQRKSIDRQLAQLKSGSQPAEPQ